MIGLALILVPLGYVGIYVGINGDGSGGYNLGTGLKNALQGGLTKKKGGQNA